MQFVVVGEMKNSEICRGLVQAISVKQNHSAAFWTEKHYLDNESQLGGKQPVIFVGRNKASKDFERILPKKSSNFGTSCHYEGARALLVWDEPEFVSKEDCEKFKKAVEKEKKTLEMKIEADISAGQVVAGGAAVAGGVALAAGGTAAILAALVVGGWPLLIGGAIAVASWLFGSKNYSGVFKKAQPSFAVADFLNNHFDAYEEESSHI